MRRRVSTIAPSRAQSFFGSPAGAPGMPEPREGAVHLDDGDLQIADASRLLLGLAGLRSELGLPALDVRVDACRPPGDAHLAVLRRRPAARGILYVALRIGLGFSAFCQPAGASHARSDGPAAASRARRAAASEARGRAVAVGAAVDGALGFGLGRLRARAADQRGSSDQANRLAIVMVSSPPSCEMISFMISRVPPPIG